MKRVPGLLVIFLLAVLPDLVHGFALRLFNSEVYNKLKSYGAKETLKPYMALTGPAVLPAGPRLTGMGRLFTHQPDEGRRRDPSGVVFRPVFGQKLLEDCGDYTRCKAQLLRILTSNLNKQRQSHLPHA
ncbi:hypothetical protein RvY_17915 [Ramazzottius varieornatus]|uniref:Uncharacterized protein n=1 Tax=Ramazzottius varieornatus TaxID=947166 RepID=A0A1D1W9I6_RAMVA|nr:hypothetical protein RvY_17915 [Ramazzottius varieornatus]